MNAWRRFEPYLYSRRNIAGSLLGLGGLGLYFAGVLAGPIGLGAVAALYAIGALVVPPDRNVSLDLSAGQDTGRIRSGLDQLLSSINGRVAPDIYDKVSSIRDSILLTLPSNSSADPADPNVYLIQQTALTYLPQALQSYLAVPRLFAERRAVAGGRTPHDVLLDQLNLMAGKLEEVADDIARHDSDRLLANGRFLAERFGTSSLEIGANAGNASGVVPDVAASPTRTTATVVPSTRTTAAAPARPATRPETSSGAPVGDGVAATDDDPATAAVRQAAAAADAISAAEERVH